MKNIKFHVTSSKISEIDASSKAWVGENVVSISNEELQEITKDDQKPFFAEFAALYHDVSKNQKVYTPDSVKSCVDAMIGVNMYKGHEEPGTESWKYREPVGRIVQARLGELSIPDDNGRMKTVPCAFGKAYISDGDQKLRADIKKGMAGAVSILGTAKMVTENGSARKTVLAINKPLKSVDFCNPSTAGLPHAGVTAIVSEIVGDDNDNNNEESKMKLTREQLLAEYTQDINAIVGEQIDSRVAEIAQRRRELAESKVKNDEEKRAFSAQIAEVNSSLERLKIENEDLKKKLANEKNIRLNAELKVAASAVIAEMKAAEGADSNLIDLVIPDVELNLINDDVEQSKAAYKTKLSGQIAKLQKVAEMFGGEKKVVNVNTVNRGSNNKEGDKKNTLYNKIVSPSLVKKS